MSRGATAIHILLVENNEDDIASFRRAFQKSGVLHDIVSYQCAEEAMKRLQNDSGSFDMLVVNHRLPGMSGLSFFKKLRAKHILLPLIFLTETGFEKLAAQALKAGIEGCLVKDPNHGYLDLLPAVLPNVLQQYEDRLRRMQIEEELKKAHLLQERTLKFTEALLTAIPTPVFYKDREGRYLGCNRAFSEIMGVTSEEMRGKTVFEIWTGEQAKVYHQKDLELMESLVRQVYEFTIFDKNGMDRAVIYAKDVFRDEKNRIAGIVGAFTDITERKVAEEAREKIVNELQEALAKVKLLSGLLPICSYCKKIRDDRGYWNQIESYIRRHSEAKFSHGLCPDCANHFYPEFFSERE
jgi:PAS domain S-box-containing protein